MLDGPMKNSLFVTMVAQHRTPVSGLERSVFAVGQDIVSSLFFFPTKRNLRLWLLPG